MSDFGKRHNRHLLVRFVVFAIIGILVLRIAYLQLYDGSYYDDLSGNNYLRYVVKYPPRGEIYDRNGQHLVQSKECYDLMVIYRDIPKSGFDTLSLTEAIDLSKEKLVKSLRDAAMSPRRAYPVAKFLDTKNKILLSELNIPGFYTVPRTVRQYPRKIGGNLLGHIGEISAAQLKIHEDYAMGDYIGIDGLEAAYEPYLRGEKGLILHDIYANDSSRDTIINHEVQGRALTCTIDADLQQLAEELMKGKVGAVVAIEPSSGEILVMASSPTFDPDELVGRDRGKNYIKELNNPRKPLYNRAVKSRYPPGSTFKLAQGLIGLQEGVLTPSERHDCHGGYSYGNKKMKCHAHPSPLDLDFAIATSCNAYFCYVFQNILNNRKYGSIKTGYEVWCDYVDSFGYGRKLDSDFMGEEKGFLPTREFYDRRYRKSWNALTILSLSIGQGEMGCTPMQMANFAATIANRGYYYIPHIVKKIEGIDSIDSRFYKKNYTKVDSRHYQTIAKGMWRGVNVDGTCRGAHLDGWDVCGKTGTAQNPNGKDHSTFISFAPLNNPKIAIAVYVEHGGFGASVAVPIASLIEEKYLTGEIKRPELMEYVKNLNINYYNYDKKAKKKL